MNPTESRRKPQSWQDEVGIPRRFPRTHIKEIGPMLNNLEEPEVLLRKRREAVEIVIRLKSSPRSLQYKLITEFETPETTFSGAFKEILRTKLRGTHSKVWAAFSRIATEAYSQTWMHFLASPGHSHPVTRTDRQTIINKVEQETKLRHKGRRSITKAEVLDLHKRYAAFLQTCTHIHDAVERAASVAEPAKAPSQTKIREAVWLCIKSKAHRVPSIDRIFDGSAFETMPYKHRPKLHLPNTWKPQQLATKLIAIEHNVEFQTAQKMISAMLRDKIPVKP